MHERKNRIEAMMAMERMKYGDAETIPSPIELFSLEALFGFALAGRRPEIEIQPRSRSHLNST